MKRDLMFVDDFFEEDNSFTEYLNTKEPAYSPNNTVYYYLCAKTYVDSQLKKSMAQRYEFIKIARTFSKWEEEVKVVFNDEMSKKSFGITNNMITIPTCAEDINEKETWRDFDLLDDAIIFTVNELRAIQQLKTKGEIIDCKSISFKNKKFLLWMWKNESKRILPNDVIYLSLMHASYTSGKFQGLPIIWDSTTMKGAVGSVRRGFIKAILMSDLGKCDYKVEDFDYYPITITLDNGKSKNMTRKQIASYFRKRILLIA